MKITTATTIRTDSGSFEISIAPTGEADLIACSMTGMSAQDVQELADLFAEAVRHLPADPSAEAQLEKAGPRTWSTGDEIPADVKTIRDREGDLWDQGGLNWMCRNGEAPWPEGRMLRYYGPVAEVAE